MTNIWERQEKIGFLHSKSDTVFSGWRLMLMECLCDKGLSDGEAGDLIRSLGLRQLGLEYDRNVTAQELADRLIQNR